MIEKFTIGLLDDVTREVRKESMRRPSINDDSEDYFTIPDLQLILGSWEDRYTTSNERSLESILIINKYPLWFVQLCKKAEGSCKSSIIHRLGNTFRKLFIRQRCVEY